jgi:hypothetical protein
MIPLIDMSGVFTAAAYPLYRASSKICKIRFWHTFYTLRVAQQNYYLSLRFEQSKI